MFKYTNNPQQVRFIKKMNWTARQLRRRETPAEKILWKYLRKNQLLEYKFRRQHAIYKYIVDFVCHKRKLILEIDGEIHNQQVVYDKYRDEFLQSLGYKVIRFTNNEVQLKTQWVLNKITSLLKGGGAPADSGGGEGLIGGENCTKD